MERRFSVLPWAAAALIVVGLAAGAVVLGVLVSAHRAADTLVLNCGGPALKRALADNRTYTSHTTPRPRSITRGDTTKSVFNTVAEAPNGIDLVYTFSVNPGSKVEITAKFVELLQSAKRGSRVLRLLFNGEIVRDNLDVFDTVGALGKDYQASKTIKTKSGAVEIRVHPLAGNAMLAGIDVLARGGVRAGGPLAQPVNDTNNSTTTTQGNNTTQSNNPDNTTSTSSPIGNTTSSDTTSDSDSETSQPKPAPPTAPKTPRMVGSGTWNTVSLRSSVRPAARHEACSVMAGGLVYLIGGRGKRPVSVYDPKTHTWTTKKTPSVEMNHMQCVAVGSKIYVVGAWFGGFPNEKVHQNTWVYDTTTDTWAKEPAPPSGRNRGSGAAVYHLNAIYLSHGNIGGHGKHAKSLGLLDRYDLTTKTWTPLAPAPDARDHVGGGIVDGKLCIAGGRDGGVDNFWGTPITPVNCYDFGSNAWKRGANMPVGRAGAATGATCNGFLMVAGGEGRDPGTTSGGDAYARVDLYDVKNDKWLPHTNLKQKRHGSGLAISQCSGCGNIYLPSGAGSLGGAKELSDMEVWSPDGQLRDC